MVYPIAPRKRGLASVFYLLVFLFFVRPRVFGVQFVALFVVSVRNAPLKRFSNSRSFSEAF